MWIAADEEAEIATAIGIGAAGGGAGATLDIPTTQRPLGRALSAGRLCPHEIEMRSNRYTADRPAK